MDAGRAFHIAGLLALLAQLALPTAPLLYTAGDSIPWPQGWTHVGILVLHNPTNVTVENYLINITIDFSDQVAKGYVRTDLADVRFTDTQGNFIHFNMTGQDVYTGHFLLKIPVLKPGDNMFYIFYGNPGAYYPIYNDLDMGNKTLEVNTPVSVTDTYSDSSILSKYHPTNILEDKPTLSVDNNKLAVQPASAAKPGGTYRFPDQLTNIKPPIKVTAVVETAGYGVYISDGTDSWIGYLYSTSTFSIRHQSGSSGTTKSVSVSASFPANITLSYNGSQLVFYLNGSAVDTESVALSTLQEAGIGYYATTIPGYVDLYSISAAGVGNPVTYTVLLEVAPSNVVYQPTATPRVLNNTINNTLQGHEFPLPDWLAVHRSWVAIGLSLAPLLIATEANAAVMALVSAGLLASFTAMGWVDAPSGAVGVALFIAGAGVVASRKNP